MGVNVSVSSLQRAFACTASTVLPRNPDTRGAAAARGDLIHAVIASELRGWERPDTGRYRLKYDMDVLREAVGTGILLCELAMAYDGTAVEVLGENIGRDYKRPAALCGSADIVVIDGKHAHVIDIKTGSLPVPSPLDNWQISALALFVSLFFEVDSVTGVIAKLERDGSWQFDSARFTADALASVKKRLDERRALWAIAEEAMQSGWGVEPTPSTSCRFCRCQCPHADAKTYPVNQEAA